MALTTSQREKSKFSQVREFMAALFEKLNANGLAKSTGVSFCSWSPVRDWYLLSPFSTMRSRLPSL